MQSHGAQAGVKRRDIREILRFETVEQLHKAAAFFHANFRSDEIALQGVTKAMGDLEHPYKSAWEFKDHGVSTSFSIDARKNDDGSYFLSIRRGTDHTIEVELAKKLGLQIGYTRCEIERTWPSEGKHFTPIPLHDIESVYQALGQTFEPNEFLAAIKVRGHSQRHASHTMHYVSPITITNKKNISVTIDLDLVHSVFDQNSRNDVNYILKYHIENDYFMEKTKSDYGRLKPTIMTITIKPIVEKRTFSPLLRERIRKLGDKVEAAMRKTIPTPTNATNVPPPPQL